MHLGKYLITMAMVALMSSCSIADRFADHSLEYNLQAETMKNQNLLNNIIRSAYRKPLQFTEISVITGQVSVSGTAAFALPFAGPHSNFIFSPNVTLSDSPIWTISVLNTQEFYNGILGPIKPETISYYLSETFPSRVLLTLLISEIEAGGVVYSNNPTNYWHFYPELERLILQGLTVKPISETKVLGPPLTAQEVQKMDIAKLDAQHITVVQHKNLEKADQEPRSELATIGRGGFYYQLEKSDRRAGGRGQTNGKKGRTKHSADFEQPRQSGYTRVASRRTQDRAEGEIGRGGHLLPWRMGARTNHADCRCAASSGDY
jgi:hypothetical protein